VKTILVPFLKERGHLTTA